MDKNRNPRNIQASEISAAFAPSVTAPIVTHETLIEYAEGGLSEIDREIVESMLEVDSRLAAEFQAIREELAECAPERMAAIEALTIPPGKPPERRKLPWGFRWATAGGFALVIAILVVANRSGMRTSGPTALSSPHGNLLGDATTGETGGSGSPYRIAPTNAEFTALTNGVAWPDYAHVQTVQPVEIAWKLPAEVQDPIALIFRDVTHNRVLFISPCVPAEAKGLNFDSLRRALKSKGLQEIRGLEKSGKLPWLKDLQKDPLLYGEERTFTRDLFHKLEKMTLSSKLIRSHTEYTWQLLAHSKGGLWQSPEVKFDTL